MYDCNVINMATRPHFPRFLRDGIGDYGVDPDDRQEQRYAAADCEQAEREARPRHGPVMDFLHGLKLGDRKASVDGPDGLSNFGHEAFRSGAGTANEDGHRIRIADPRADGPVDAARRFLLGAIIAYVAGDADDLAPFLGRE